MRPERAEHERDVLVERHPELMLRGGHVILSRLRDELGVSQQVLMAAVAGEADASCIVAISSRTCHATAAAETGRCHGSFSRADAISAVMRCGT